MHMCEAWVREATEVVPVTSHLSLLTAAVADLKVELDKVRRRGRRA